MAVDDHSLKRAARVCAGRDQGECRPSNPAQWCTRQGEVGLREGERSRAYRERDRRRADEEAKHDGDRSRVCDVRELVRASHLGRLQKLPRWRAKILVAIVKNVAERYVIVTLSVAIEICVCDLKIHQNIRDYNRHAHGPNSELTRTNHSGPYYVQGQYLHSRSRVLVMWLLFKVVERKGRTGSRMSERVFRAVFTAP
jgi:hypothetical protein